MSLILLLLTAQEAREIRGVFRSIDRGTVTIGQGDGGRRAAVFELANGAAVAVDGRPATPADLAEGMSVRLSVAAGKVLEVRAEGATILGELKAVDRRLVVLAGKPSIAYYLEPETRVTVDGREAKTSDLKPGLKVELGMSADGLRVLALAQKRESRSLRAELLDLQPRARTLMFRQGEGGAVSDLPLAPGATIRLDGRPATLDDLSPLLPLRARVTLSDDQAMILDVEAQK